MAEPTIIAPEGELDIESEDDFRGALGDAAGRAADVLVVDLSDVSFIDSRSVSAVIEAHDRLRRDKRQLLVVAPRGSAAALVLTLAGLRTRLSVFETCHAALSA